MPLDPKKPSLDGERFYTIPQVADVLGLSDKTIRNWIKKNELPAYRVGRRWRIAEKDVKLFLRDRWSG